MTTLNLAPTSKLNNNSTPEMFDRALRTFNSLRLDHKIDTQMFAEQQELISPKTFMILAIVVFLTLSVAVGLGLGGKL